MDFFTNTFNKSFFQNSSFTASLKESIKSFTITYTGPELIVMVSCLIGLFLILIISLNQKLEIEKNKRQKLKSQYFHLQNVFNLLFQLSYEYGIKSQQTGKFFIPFKKILEEGLPFLDTEKLGSRTYIEYACELLEREKDGEREVYLCLEEEKENLENKEKEDLIKNELNKEKTKNIKSKSSSVKKLPTKKEKQSRSSSKDSSEDSDLN